MAETLPCVRQMLNARDFRDVPQVVSLVGAVRARFGDAVAAVVLYGSFARGQRDTLVDLYVLLDRLEDLPGWQRILGTLLSPNVYHIVTDQARAKVAVMTFDQLERGVRADIAPYFWARFAQPTTLVYSRDGLSVERFERIVGTAAQRLFNASAMGADEVPASQAFWIQTFGLTYAAELRPEQEDRYRTLYDANRPYFDAVHQTFAGQAHPPQTSWRIRTLASRVLSFLRIAKSALTFDDPLDYALWKVERHSGVKLTATEKQKRYPLIFGWPLVWQAYRRGVFR